MAIKYFSPINEFYDLNVPIIALDFGSNLKKEFLIMLYKVERNSH